MNSNENFKMCENRRNTRRLNDFCPKTSMVYIVFSYTISDTNLQVRSSGGRICKSSHLHIHEYL